jgi:hypothetical protein
MKAEGHGNTGGGMLPWDARRYLRHVNSDEARLSRGFLRSRPEKWFPGLGRQWLPLIHSLGIEVRLNEIRPVAVMPPGMSRGFVGTVDDEPMGIFVDAASLRTVLDAVAPGAVPAARDITSEYLARRLLGSLASSWSGPESSVVRFDPERDTREVAPAAAIKIGFSVNGNACELWLALGKVLVERLDGLWRRQVRSSSRQSEREVEVHLELSQLAVPPSMLVDYMRAGSRIDLEIPLSDLITVRLGSGTGSRAWMPARMINVDGRMGFEVLPGPAITPPLPDGTTRLSIEIGSFVLDGAMLPELGQPGAMLETDFPLGAAVVMAINSEKVADASLCSYEGRFAITVR